MDCASHKQAAHELGYSLTFGAKAPESCELFSPHPEGWG